MDLAGARMELVILFHMLTILIVGKRASAIYPCCLGRFRVICQWMHVCVPVEYWMYSLSLEVVQSHNAYGE